MLWWKETITSWLYNPVYSTQGHTTKGSLGKEEK